MANNQLAFETSTALSRVWLAAHWEKRLTKNVICTHDITESVNTIKSPGNVYSLRISGYLLLGIVKIYYKKSIITLEELEQSLQSLTQSSIFQSSEVLKEIGITEVPEKLKLVQISKREFLNPLEKTGKIPENLAVKKNVFSNPVVETENFTRENDFLGVTTSFLDDVEMAEQWLRNETEDDVELPMKRSRGRVWESFISDVVVVDETAEIPENFEPKDEESKENLPEANEEVTAETVTRVKYRKKIIKENSTETVIDPELHMGLDCTADIVKNTRLYQPLFDILPNDMEQIFYIPVLKDIAPELENFYLSHIKIQRLKNLFREEEKEPIILSNTVPERPENPIVPVVEPEENMIEQEPEIVPKEEKVEEKPDESWSSRTLKLLKLLKIRLNSQKSIFFEDLSKRSDRRVMACGFYEVLQLCLKDFIIMEVLDEKVSLLATERLLRMSLF